MGRQQYLIRLALGRSAYEDGPSRGTETSLPLPLESKDGQQYDSKGRPTNPRIGVLNAEIRKAQNEVLETVGVVERKESMSLVDELRFQSVATARRNVLDEEQDYGETLELAILPIKYLSHAWLEAFIARLQIGSYNLQRPIGRIIAQELDSIRSTSFSHAFAALFPGAISEVVMIFMAKGVLALGIEQIAGRVQIYANKVISSRQSRQKVLFLISCLIETVFFAIELVFLPVELHVCAQRLGLAPKLPIFPPLKIFWPRSSSSYHRFGWKPTIGLAMIRSFTSPFAFLLLSKYLRAHSHETAECFFCRVFSPWHYPPLTHTPPLSAPSLRNPIRWLTYHAWYLRHRLLRAMGWDLEEACIDSSSKATALDAPGPTEHPIDAATSALDNNVRAVESSTHPRLRYRSTALAHLPAQALADALDAGIARLMTLPWESLLLRVVAATCVDAASSSSMPLSEAATGTGGRDLLLRLYRPFGGGPWGRVMRNPGSGFAWREVGCYCSALGLAFALNCAVDAVLFAGVYGAARSAGVTRFDWGQREQIGGVRFRSRLADRRRESLAQRRRHG